MNLERGLRRLVLATSFGAMIASGGYFVATVQDTRALLQRVAEYSPRCTVKRDGNEFVKNTQACVDETGALLLEIIARPEWRRYPDTIIGIGITVTLGLGAAPWVIFYLVRWIARGFSP